MVQGHHHHGHSNENPKNSANDRIHRSSTDDLIKRFESPKKDAYQQPEKVMQYLGASKGKTIMDIGDGSCYFSVKLAAKGEKVIAADVSDGFQAHLKKRIEDHNLRNIELRKIPYDHPARKDSEVDMVFIVNTCHHFDRRAEYFTLAKKGLKKNSELVVINFFKSDIPVGTPTKHKVSMDEVIAELKSAWYSNFKVEVNLLPYPFTFRAR
jgi:cyclopropane fatty-acyl-phospholipid synthase-like methyltransferase